LRTGCWLPVFRRMRRSQLEELLFYVPASVRKARSRIYCLLANEPNEQYQTLVDRMARHFGSPSSVIFNHAQFTRYLQRPGDAEVQFLLTLHEIARKCDFPPAQFNERVRDQIAAGCTNGRIRERLLQEPGDRTLENLELVALTLERAQQESPALTPTASVTLVDCRKRSARPLTPISLSSCGNCTWSFRKYL
jgi:hypothetical protein